MKKRIVKSFIIVILSLSRANAFDVTFRMKDLKPIEEPSMLYWLTPFGADEDKNGIRDDVQNFILKIARDENLKLGLFYYAFYIQEAMKLAFNKKEYLENYKKLHGASRCLIFLSINPKPIASKNLYYIELQVLKKMKNNPLRKFLYDFGKGSISDDMGYNKLIGILNCLKNCPFKIKNLKSYLDFWESKKIIDLNARDKENLIGEYGE